jgi:hypothetical protein
VRRRLDSGVSVTLHGRGDSLMRAAWALGPKVAASLGGRSSRRLPEIELPEELELPERIAVGQQVLDGDAGQRFALDVPPWIELQRAARLELRLAYDAPAGGDTIVGINGAPLGAKQAPRKGKRRDKLVVALAGEGPPSRRRELLAGQNLVSLELRPGEGGEAPCPVNGVQLLPGSGVKVRASRRDPAANLGLWPFPLASKPAARGSAVVLPPDPTRGELAAAVGTLAAAARVSDSPWLASVRFGSLPQRPDRHTLALVRPGRVPGWARSELGRRPAEGTLAALGPDDDHVAVIAVGARALKPLSSGYAVGDLRGRVVAVDARGKLRLAAGPAERPAAVEGRNVPWEAPLAVLLAGIAVLAAMGARSAVQRIRRLPPTEAS